LHRFKKRNPKIEPANNPRKSNGMNPKSTKYYLGLFLIVLGFFTPAFTFLVINMPISTEWKGILSALLTIGGPEILMIIGVSISGKEVIHDIKGTIKRYLNREIPAGPISKAQHKTGLVLLILGFLIPLTAAYIAPFVTYHFTSSELLGINLLGDSLAILSISILGDPFLSKLSELFRFEPEWPPKQGEYEMRFKRDD
jgi:hypothetical protein